MHEEIINLYCNEFLSIPDLIKKGFKKSEIYKALENKKRSRIESLKKARENPNKFKWSEEKKKTFSIKCKEDNKNKPKRVMSDEARSNLSKGMIKAHKEGRAHCWNSAKEESYPESFFREFLEKNRFEKNKDFFQEFPIGRYRADFFFPLKKIIIEIDGGQHARWNRREHDERKDAFAKSLNYIVIRIWWRALYNDKKELLKIIKTILESQNSEISIQELTIRQALILGKLKEKNKQKEKQLIKKQQERQSIAEQRLNDAKMLLGEDQIISKLSLRWNVEKHFVKRFFNKYFPGECITRVTCKCKKKFKTESSYLSHKKKCLEH